MEPRPPARHALLRQRLRLRQLAPREALRPLPERRLHVQLVRRPPLPELPQPVGRAEHRRQAVLGPAVLTAERAQAPVSVPVVLTAALEQVPVSVPAVLTAALEQVPALELAASLVVPAPGVLAALLVALAVLAGLVLEAAEPVAAQVAPKGTLT